MSYDYSEHTKLAEAKQMRKRADEDARLLANRIALLKQEELKAQKKIEETKRKAQEIVSLRSKNTEMVKQKEEKRLQQEEDDRIRNERNKHFRDQTRNMKFHKAMVRQNRAASEANALKRNRQQNLEVIENGKAQDLIQKAALRNFIRSQHRDAEERKRKLERDRKEKARVETEKRIEDENRQRRVREDEVARMEQEELELIQRLQNTQLLQKNAYEELENALAGQIGLGVGF